MVLTTPLVRALARRHPEAKLVYVTKRAMAPLVADNPHLAEVVALEPDEPIRHLARRLSALAPTHGLDLHGSVRSALLRLLVRCRWSGYRKRKLPRTLLIATKLDAYRARVPVAERYFEAAAQLDTRPDGGPPEFHLGRGATERVAQWLMERGLADARLAALAPGAAHATKRWPVAHWSALIEQLRDGGYRPVVVGGPEDRGLAQQLVASGGGAGGAARRGTGATPPGEGRWIGLVGAAARGPKRDGLFALWLILRAAEGLLPPGAVSPRNHRRRLQALESRLASLALPAPLKRALTAALQHP